MWGWEKVSAPSGPLANALCGVAMATTARLTHCIQGRQAEVTTRVWLSLRTMDRVRGHMQSRAQSQYTAVQGGYPVLWTWSLSREVTSFEEPSWSSTGWLFPVITDWRANSQVCVLACELPKP